MKTIKIQNQMPSLSCPYAAPILIISRDFIDHSELNGHRIYVGKVDCLPSHVCDLVQRICIPMLSFFAFTFWSMPDPIFLTVFVKFEKAQDSSLVSLVKKTKSNENTFPYIFLLIYIFMDIEN